METQNQLILNHLSKYKTITTIQAFELYGITRLPSRIFDLRESGHKIGMIWENNINRFGLPTRYRKYFIIK